MKAIAIEFIHCIILIAPSHPFERSRITNQPFEEFDANSTHKSHIEYQWKWRATLLCDWNENENERSKEKNQKKN